MSWDIIEYDEFSNCACGKGKVVRHMQQRDDDWNRSETRCLGEEIQCVDCAKKYHIEHHIRHYLCKPWKGDGISDRAFLVPNGISIPSYVGIRSFNFSEIDKEIASMYTLEEINASLNDMLTNKYTTRLKLDCSHSIVRIYNKAHKKKSLSLIVPVLENIIQNYDKYEWTPETIKEYRIRESEEIRENNKAIDETMAKSFELNFRR